MLTIFSFSQLLFFTKTFFFKVSSSGTKILDEIILGNKEFFKIEKSVGYPVKVKGENNFSLKFSSKLKCESGTSYPFLL